MPTETTYIGSYLLEKVECALFVAIKEIFTIRNVDDLQNGSMSKVNMLIKRTYLMERVNLISGTVYEIFTVVVLVLVISWQK